MSLKIRSIKNFIFVWILLIIFLVSNVMPTMNGFATTDEIYFTDEYYFDDDYIIGPYTPGTFILNTTWHQSGIYAMKAPLKDSSVSASDPANHWRVGCWSTAIGQIINYHQLQSHGNCWYTCSVLTDSFGDPLVIANNLDETTYYWFNMNTSISTTSPTAEIDNVTQLLYDVSTAIQKDFGTGGYINSSTGRTNGVKEHFEYISSETEFAINPPINEIISEINHLRPCMLYIDNWNSTIGHAVALDGYRWANGKFQVHLNMGWGGSADGWYVYNESINAGSYIFNGTIRGLMYIRTAPYIPLTPLGPELANPGSMVNMNTSTTSHRNLPLYYKWDWGDGTYSRWLGRYDSGEVSTVSHSWRSEGTYHVRVKAMNTKGEQSEWSRPHTITIFSALDRYIDNVKKRLMQGKIGDPTVDMKLELVIDHLDDSIIKGFWRDGKHLEEKMGHRVFSEHKAAIQKLQELSQHKNVPNDVIEICNDAINNIVRVDYLLAKIALDEATAPINIEKNKQEEHQEVIAEDRFNSGEDYAADGDINKAVDEFRKSWEHSWKA
jgi:hypothetical protein